jgi:hypothetical protein
MLRATSLLQSTLSLRTVWCVTSAFGCAFLGQGGGEGGVALCRTNVHDRGYAGPLSALQQYMHEFHADRDHAMCNIQNRSIPELQLTQLRKLSNKNF